jgi:hypothetical protein
MHGLKDFVHLSLHTERERRREGRGRERDSEAFFEAQKETLLPHCRERTALSRNLE